MKRRKFLAASALAGIFAQSRNPRLLTAMTNRPLQAPLPRRPYNNEVDLSIVGFGAIVIMGMEQREANRVVAEAVDGSINYFDVAPSYGDGEAEEKLGPALEPHRKQVFLACKTLERDARGAETELIRSLRRLKTDHIDLYQFHAVTQMEEVDQIFASGGALETFVKARQEGKIRYIGFSAHSEAAACAMMDRFRFDSILFPFNLVCYARGNFGPAVMDYAKQKGVARLALKMLARGPWPEGAEKTYPKVWYQPIDALEEARNAVRFSLSEDITAAVPPGEVRLYRLALNLASDFQPLSAEERAAILAGTEGMMPLFHS
jgi:aryl-alcohol dehydrogenase-like predicted oxidoreductase